MRALLFALLFAATPALAEQLYVVGESKEIRYLIDVHSIKISEPDSNDPFIHVNLAAVRLDSGAAASGVATTRVSACDNEGGRGMITINGDNKSVVWAKSGTRIYDSLFLHTCEWLLVILKKNPDQLFGTTAPKPTKPKVQA